MPHFNEIMYYFMLCALSLFHQVYCSFYFVKMETFSMPQLYFNLQWTTT